MEKSLKKNVSWMFIGNSVYAFTQWVQLSLISKFCSTNTLGVYTLALAVSAPVFLLLGLQLRSLLVTDSVQEWQFSSYFSLRVLCMFVALLIITLFSIISDENNFQLLILVSLLKFIEGLAEIFNAQQLVMEQMRYVAQSLILKGIAASAAIFIGIYYFDCLSIGLLIAIVLNLSILIVNDYGNCKKAFNGKRFINNRNLKLKSLFVKSIPLGIVICIISLNTNLSKYFLEHFLGTEQQAIYSTIAYCLVLGNFVGNAIGQSFSPRMSRYYKERKIIEFKSILFKYLILNVLTGVSLFVLSLFGGYYFLKIMFSEEIAVYSRLFSLVMFSGIFMYTASALGYSMTSMRIFKVQPLINGTVLVANFIFCSLFIRQFGIYGVAYATSITFFIQIMITTYIIWRGIRLK